MVRQALVESERVPFEGLVELLGGLRDLAIMARWQPEFDLAGGMEGGARTSPCPPGLDIFFPYDLRDRSSRPLRLGEVDTRGQVVDRLGPVRRQLPRPSNLRGYAFAPRVSGHESPRDQMSHAVFQGSRGVRSSRCRDDDVPRHVREEVVEGVSLPLTVLRVLKEVRHERSPEENRKPVRAVVLQPVQIGVQEGCQLFLLELLLKVLRGPRDLPMMVDGQPDLDLAARS